MKTLIRLCLIPVALIVYTICLTARFMLALVLYILSLLDR